MVVHSPLVNKILEEQKQDRWIKNIRLEIQKKPTPESTIEQQNGLQFKQRLVVPDDATLRKEIMDEAHRSKYTIHPGETKMYKDLKRQFWWENMRVDIAKYVAHCNTCKVVKAKHMKPGGTLQPLKLPEWKWENISMDFIVGLPVCQRTPFG